MSHDSGVTSLTGQSGDAIQVDVKTPVSDKKEPKEITQSEKSDPKVKNDIPVTRSSSAPLKSQTKNKVDSGIEGDQGKSQSMIEYNSASNDSVDSVIIGNKLQIEGIASETVDSLDTVGLSDSKDDPLKHTSVHRTEHQKTEKVKLGQMPRVISIVKDENLDRESSTDEPEPTIIATDADITNYVVDKLVAESNRIQETAELQQTVELQETVGLEKTAEGLGKDEKQNTGDAAKARLLRSFRVATVREKSWKIWDFEIFWKL